MVAANHAKRVGAKLVSYLQDIYPDVAEAIGKANDGLVTREIRKRLRSAYQSSQRVIVLGSCMKERLVAEPWGIDQDKIQIVPNWADTELIRPVDAKDKFVSCPRRIDRSFCRDAQRQYGAHSTAGRFGGCRRVGTVARFGGHGCSWAMVRRSNRCKVSWRSGPVGSDLICVNVFVFCPTNRENNWPKVFPPVTCTSFRCTRISRDAFVRASCTGS